jgi:hypothetical protein
LIDAIVRQTTVLLAQVSTASGVRSPLAHLADQVFLSLAQEIESQGVSRKVAADMFGLALRGYQRKVQRVLDTAAHREQTLWESMIAFLDEAGPTTRARLLERFSGHEESGVLAVAADLVDGGLAYRSGRGEGTLYGILSEAVRSRFDGEESRKALANFVWLSVFRGPRREETELAAELGATPEAVAQAVATLVADGRLKAVEVDGRRVYEAAPFVVPIGAAEGWQAAVFDHFQAVTTAIAAKLRRGRARSDAKDEVGGTTLHFGIHPAHPRAEEVLGTLRRTREALETLWDEVTAHNRAHPVPEEERTVVTFYFGQTIRKPDDEEES